MAAQTKQLSILVRSSSAQSSNSFLLGGAPSSPAVLEFLRECFGPIVSDGYGSTEVGSIALEDGTLISNVDFHITDVPDYGYFSTDLPFPRGELLVKTKHAIKQYYQNETETKKAFDDEGW